MNSRTIYLAVMGGLLALSLSLPAWAQEKSTVTKLAAEQTTQSLSKSNKLKLSIRKIDDPDDCGDDCPSTKDSIALPDGGGTNAHTCSGGNCSCAGAKDCVDMKKICAPKTMSCNDYGCTCAEKPDEGGG